MAFPQCLAIADTEVFWSYKSRETVGLILCESIRVCSIIFACHAAHARALAHLLNDIRARQYFFMKGIIDWINENKDWIFSGIGASLLITLATLLTRKKRGSPIPRLEIEIQKNGSLKRNAGLSPNNPRVVNAIDALYYFEMTWNYIVVIRNNSSVTAYHPRIAIVGGVLSYLQQLNGNIPIASHGEVRLEANFMKTIETKGPESVRIFERLPNEIADLGMRLEYEDESNKRFTTMFDYNGGRQRNHLS